MNNPLDQEKEPEPGLAGVATEIIEMLEDYPSKYISVDIVPIKSGDVIDYNMHRNWVNLYEDAVPADAPRFPVDEGVNVADLISNLIGFISQNVKEIDDTQAIRFIVSYAKSIFYVNAIMQINKPPIPGGEPNDGGVLVTIDIAAARAAEEAAAKTAMETETARVAAEVESDAKKVAEEAAAAAKVAAEEVKRMDNVKPPPPPMSYAAAAAMKTPKMEIAASNLPVPPPTDNSVREAKRIAAAKNIAEYERQKQLEKDEAERRKQQDADDWNRYEAEATLAETKAAEEAKVKAAAEKEAKAKSDAEAKARVEAAKKFMDEQAAMVAAEKAAAEQKKREEIQQRVAAEKAAAEEAQRRADEAAIIAAEEAEKKRLADEAEKKRLADEAEKKRLLAEEAEKKRLADEAEQKRLADEAEKKRLLAEEAEKKRLADEAEKKRLLAEEAENKRLAEEAENKRLLAEEAVKKRLAEEAEKKRLAEEAEKKRLAEEAEKKRFTEEAEKAAAEKAAAEKAAAEKAAAAEEERAELERVRLVKEKAVARISTFVANKRAQKQEIDDTWRDSNADEALVEKLATQAQITENLNQIRVQLDYIIKSNRLVHQEFQPYIDKITNSYNNLNEIIKNNQSPDIIAMLGKSDILKKLSLLLLALSQKRNAIGVPTYSIAQKTDINKQSSEILVAIELVQLQAAKSGSDKFEDIELFTNDIGKAILPAKSVAESTPTTDISHPPAIPSAKRREPLFPTRPPADVDVNLAATSVPIAKPDKSPPTNRTQGFMSPTFASQMRENEEKKVVKAAATHMEAAAHNRETYKNPVHIGEKYTNKPRSGGQSTKKKSRKSSHNKRHTKRAMPGKPQTKTRNKRTKRGRNQTHKK